MNTADDNSVNPAELHKAINTLQGIVYGILSDRKVSRKELEVLINWCRLHRYLEDSHPFSELLPVIDLAMDDGKITNEEFRDILLVCENIPDGEESHRSIASGIHWLHGLLYGLLADNYLSNKEIHLLQKWMIENDFMRGYSPYDEIESFLISALADGKISDTKRGELSAYFGQFIDQAVKSSS